MIILNSIAPVSESNIHILSVGAAMYRVVQTTVDNEILRISPNFTIASDL